MAEQLAGLTTDERAKLAALLAQVKGERE